MDWTQKIKSLVGHTPLSNPLDSYTGERGSERLMEVLLKNLAVGGDREIAMQLLDRGTLTSFERGNTIISQDANDNDVYILISGEVEIITHRQKMAIRQSPTQVGEMAAITPGQRRTASVKVTSNNLVAIKIPGNEYHSIWKGNSMFAQRLQVELSTRNAERINAGKVVKANAAYLWTIMSLLLGFGLAIGGYFVLQKMNFDLLSKSIGSALIFIAVFICIQVINPAYLYRRLFGLVAGAFLGILLFDFSGSFQIEGEFGKISVNSELAEMREGDVLERIVIYFVILAILWICARMDRTINS